MIDWVASLDPRVIQGLLTLVAAVLGSLTALYIAVFVYPRQREIDRNNEMRRERRTSYLKILSDLLEVQDTFNRIEFGNPEKALGDLKAAFHEKTRYERAATALALVATPKVLTAVIQGYDDLHRLLDAFRIVTERVLEENPNGFGAADFAVQIRSATEDAKLALLRSNEAAFNAMREEEFGLIGRITFRSRYGLEPRLP